MHKLYTVNVLGTEYEVFENNKTEDKLLESLDGYCDHTEHKCVIDELVPNTDSLGNMEAYRQKLIRHELIHAFLFESGLGANSWGTNEEIVDWIAFQFPKMLEAFKRSKAI